jgi:uncharacterized protein (DUF2147 family)
MDGVPIPARCKKLCKPSERGVWEMKRLFLLTFGMLFMAVSGNANVTGTWLTKGDKSHVSIEKCGAKLCGKIIWLKEPNTAAGAPKSDLNNTDENQRNRPILGLPLLKGFEATDDPNYWINGKIYNPEDGKIYNCEMTLQADGQLKVRGYVGVPLFGESQYWKKVKE